MSHFIIIFFYIFQICIICYFMSWLIFRMRTLLQSLQCHCSVLVSHGTNQKDGVRPTDRYSFLFNTISGQEMTDMGIGPTSLGRMLRRPSFKMVEPQNTLCRFCYPDYAIFNLLKWNLPKRALSSMMVTLHDRYYHFDRLM